MIVKVNHHELPMKKSMIFAHRGANKEAAENTRPAFDQALDYPIDGMETDVQLSRDEVSVLWHDRFLNKIGLPGKHIDEEYACSPDLPWCIVIGD